MNPLTHLQEYQPLARTYHMAPPSRTTWMPLDSESPDDAALRKVFEPTSGSGSSTTTRAWLAA